MSETPPVKQPDFALAVREARKRVGKSQRALALTIKVSEGYVTMMEQGHRVPSASVLIKLAKALDVPQDEVFCWALKLPPDVEEILLSRAQVFVPLIRVLGQRPDHVVTKLLKRMTPLTSPMEQ